MYLLARNGALNNWLREHPVAVAGIFLLLACFLLRHGIKALITGRSRSKLGHNLRGSSAKIYGAVLTAFGASCLILALFELLKAVR